MPAQPSIIESDPLYNERLAKQHTEYDPDRANEILDTIVPERDSEGYRLDPSGWRLTIIFEIDQVRTTFLDMFELAIPMFQAAGIDAQIRTMDRSLWETRVRRGSDLDATAHQFGANSGIAAMLDARYFVPFSNNSIYAPGWSLYFGDPQEPRRGRAAGGHQGAAGAVQDAARDRRSPRAEGGHGRDSGERRGSV